MFIHENNVITDGENIIFLNRFAWNDYYELMNKVMENMLDDLSKITGLEKGEIMEDYMLLNEYSPFDEILKREGINSKDKRKSLVLSIMNE